MKRFGFGLGMISALAIGAGALSACADAEEAVEPPREVPEGGTIPDMPDAGAPEETADGGDAGGDAAIDAGPKECSKEGFCHTAVPPKQSLRGVWTDGAGGAWAVSEEGAVLRWDGTAWTVHATVKGALASVWGSGPTDVWVGGEGGLFHGTGASPAALVFDSVATPDPQTPIASIWGTGKDDVWAVGGALDFPLVGRVLHYQGPNDAGDEWTSESVSRDAIEYARVFGSTQSGVWLAGRRMSPTEFWFEVVLLHRPAGEKDFSEVPLPVDPDVGGMPVGTFERLYDAAVSADGLSVFVLGRTHTATPAYAKGASADGATFTWSFENDGKFGNPQSNAIAAGSASDVWIAGEYGRLKHLAGGKWTQAVVTVTKFPLIDPFFAIGGKGADMWFVGDGVALHRDPSKAEP